MNAIVGHDPNFFLEFLAAWEKRPMCLAPMAYGWCSAISEAGLGRERLTLRIQAQDLDSYDLKKIEEAFTSVGPACDPFRMDEVSHCAHRRPRLPHTSYTGLFSILLEVGFRLVMPSHGQPAIHLDHTPHHKLVFKRTLSSDDDEVIADGVCVWVADRDHMPAGSCVHYLAKRVAENRPFSPRLRQMSIWLIERMWRSRLEVSGLGAIRLLNRLNISMDDIKYEGEWIQLLMDVILSPAGLKSLSIHYWHLLEQLLLIGLSLPKQHVTDAVELVWLLEEPEDWEKLEIWMVLLWQYRGYRADTDHLECLDHLKQATLKHLLRQPSALPMFEGLAESGIDMCVALRRVCARARAEQSSLEPLLL